MIISNSCQILTTQKTEHISEAGAVHLQSLANPWFAKQNDNIQSRKTRIEHIPMHLCMKNKLNHHVEATK